MKNIRTIQKQRGFFDLGLGFALMVLFSGTAVVIDTTHTDKHNLMQQDKEIVKIVDDKLALAETETEC